MNRPGAESGVEPLPRRVSPPAVLLASLLILSNFTVWIGASDPWWRPKEWAVFVAGLVWLCVRSRVQTLRQYRNLPFLTLLFYVVGQFTLLQVLPVASAPGKFGVPGILWVGMLHAVLFLLWFIDCIQMVKKETFQHLWKLVAGIGVMLELQMLLQRVGFDPMVTYMSHGRTLTWLHDNHMVGLMGNSFQASACLAVCIPAIFAQGWWLAGLLGLLTLLLAQSATGVMAVVLSIFFLLQDRLDRAIWASICLLGGLALSFRGFFAFSNRLPIWHQTLHLWKHRLLFGYGLGTFKLLGVKVQTAAQDAPNAVWWAHNEWLQIGVELGLIGMVCATAWLLSLLWRARHSGQKIAIATLAASLVLSLSSIPFHLAPTIVVTALALINLAVWTEEPHA